MSAYDLTSIFAGTAVVFYFFRQFRLSFLAYYERYVIRNSLPFYHNWPHPSSFQYLLLMLYFHYSEKNCPIFSFTAGRCRRLDSATSRVFPRYFVFYYSLMDCRALL